VAQPEAVLRAFFDGTTTMPDSDKSLPRREREQRRHRREILNAAAAVFADNGYHQATVQMIAEKADFSVGYLYKHFEGKEQMYREMVEYHMERLDAIIAEVRSRGLPVLEELRRTYESICDHFNQYRDFMRIYHLEAGDDFVEAFAHKKRHHRDLVESLERAHARGEIRAVDFDLLAASIQGATKELFKTFAERPGDHPFDSLTDTIFSLLIDPLRV